MCCAQAIPPGRSQALSDCLQPGLFRALGDPTRLAVLMRLAMAERPLTVSEVADCCGVHLSGVSRHLALLRDAGLVHAERVGREVRHRLDGNALTTSLRALADAIEACRCGCQAGSAGTEESRK